MNRSVYSLVLADDVVEAVDQLAYNMNTSRSNLVNQILAEYFSFSTPEKRMKDIFSDLEQLMNSDNFQVFDQASDAMISIKSALRYRYKPTIRYALELYRDYEPVIGELRVSLRTQSQPLIAVLTQFFRLWNALEDRYIGRYFPEGRVICQIDADSGRYSRKFLLPEEEQSRGSNTIAGAIADYIKAFDAALKVYFAEQDTPQQACSDVNQLYFQYCNRATII